MSGPVHTYGPTCLRATPTQDLVALRSSSEPPQVHAQFFYTSSLPIDDPLTPLPAPTSSATSNATSAPQPFSARDNITLEQTWRALEDARHARHQQDVSESAQGSRRSTLILRGKQSLENTASVAGSSLAKSNVEGIAINDQREGGQNLGKSASFKKRDVSPLGRRVKSAKRTSASSPGAEDEGFDFSTSHEGRPATTHISGSPFARPPSRRSKSPSESTLGDGAGRNSAQVEGSARDFGDSSTNLAGDAPLAQETEPTGEDAEHDSALYKIPVGVSRLHLVELPGLKMKPIYWSPLHDISDVLRATWFYKNTMLPVEPRLANELEKGYHYMRAWTDTWQDELNSCVENGADAEMKVVYKLWEDDNSATSRPSTMQDEGPLANASNNAAKEDRKNLTFAQNVAASGSDNQPDVNLFKNASVIFVDGKDAQILRPSLLPSVSRNRRPLSPIRKGRQIGVPVVRGFDRKQWDQLHPTKQTNIDMRHYIMRPQTRNARGAQICYACAIEESRPNPSDLIFVIHGIGQKLSERMESFHFTHAINGFRRSVNMELNNEEIWPHIRPDHGGIMALPINWRSTLSLEDAESDPLSVGVDPSANQYTLKDITADTIPAIRTLISDVMLDIPYYLSHHKDKMIRALVKEANRVYRLWCMNNPGFHEHGRVHLVAHSLGSVMALDVLSNQPTKLPDIDFHHDELHNDFFEFDSKNVFLCGSPAGLFLLLNKANLLPRRGRNKPGREGEDMQRGVAGEAKKYGCVAVDNLYNIMHTTDPIAYRLNAAVSSELAESLKPASVPSSSSSFFSSLGSAFRWSSANKLPASKTPSRPAAVSKLPSNVELETHDFSREEMAETRMLLLNDNGQIDYYLSGGGGPLNIQYLNMLSAHSSYWILPDFVRFVVVEIARRQDKDGTILALRAEKKKGWKS
ncbi:putative phospholipase C1020,13c [Talaromyces islandicus]|uniref:Putative phospholipase C1020,13c n=1 Tax=Talaromyces islandicus TaxID=28573 RepID=A0A0U1LLC6_TALIS|nr:putative phospholipase C1020,13c [Talaromyces islandicus]